MTTTCMNNPNMQSVSGGFLAVPPGKEACCLPVHTVTPFTMLDYPGKTACIIWFSGCNMRCGYCHNPQIVNSKGSMDIERVLNFLQKRRGLLDGVVLSGGEATLCHGLDDFANTLRKMDYAIKLDTNGTRPQVLRKLLDRGLLDYVALDYKAPAYKFREVTGIAKFKWFGECLDMLCSQSDVPFEVRTTVHTGLMDETDINAIITDLDTRRYDGRYYVQNFQSHHGHPTLGGFLPQTRTLDTSALKRPEHFTVAFRNFD